MLTTMPAVATMVPSMPPVVFLPVVLHVVSILPFTCISGRCPQRRRSDKQNTSYQK